MNLIALAGMLAVVRSAAAAPAQKEKDSPRPYSSIGSQGVSYVGPGREATYDLTGPIIRIGLLAPLQGPRKADGKAIIAAAQLALHDASRRPLPGGRRVVLAMGDQSGPAWGRLGDVIIHLVLDEHVIAVVTSASGATTHLTEQIGNKIGVPILTLSTDATTTQIDLPWIFRLGPSDALQAKVIAQDIYRARGLQRVLLVTEHDHDGRVGGEEFQIAARLLGAPRPACLLINPLQPDSDSLLALLKTKSPQAIVFWARSENARKLLQQIRAGGVHTPIYLSQEAAQQGLGLGFLLPVAAVGQERESPGIWTVASGQAGSPLRERFARRYQLSTGMFPTPVAAEAYDAVQLIVQGLREAGPNRARVRDRIASVRDSSGVSGTISFDDEGNNRASLRLVRLR
ncbi:MAG TPA: ABC transporter substrate-binding protein [Terriglobia bacterium]|nr:ABC transporter substrate-binding protein [Terriglobia bacterium]